MKVLFVGLGSIGKRHLRNLRLLVSDLVVHVLKPSPIIPDKDTLVERQFYSLTEITEFYDAIFICNPTAKHMDTLRDLNPYANNFFVEKPVHTNGDIDLENDKFIDLNKKYFVAAPLRHHVVFKEALKQDLSEVLSVRAMCSSYLPDWRKDVDYRKVYSAQKDQGGGVAIDLIHELDYLTTLFGFPQEIICRTAKLSRLEIDVEDIAVYLLVYKDKIIELHLDYFGQKSQRYFEVMTNTNHIRYDFLESSITENGAKEVLVSEDMYLEEMRAFLAYAFEDKGYSNDLLHGMKILKLARGEVI